MYREKDEGHTALSTLAGCRENTREKIKEDAVFFVNSNIRRDTTPTLREKNKIFTKWAKDGVKLLKKTNKPFVNGLQFEEKRELKDIILGDGLITSDKTICESVLKFAKSSQTKEKPKLLL